MNQPTFIININKRVLISLILTFLALPLFADKTTEFYNRLTPLSSADLFEKGHSYQQSGTDLDSALVCFTILGNRANASKERHEHILCIKAYAEMAYIWYFHYYDYSKAIENMAKAQELMEKWGENVTQVNLYYGLMFGSIGTQSRDMKTRKMAIDYLKKSFYSALENREHHLVNVSFSNLLSQAYTLQMTDSIADIWTKFHDFAQNKEGEEFYTLFNVQMHNGLKALQEGRHDDAQAAFDILIERLPLSPQYSRYRCGAWEFKGFIYQDAKKYPEAEKAFQEALAVTHDNDLRDARMEIYKDLAELYPMMGRNEDRNIFENKYLNIKDSLLSYRQICAMDEIRFLGDLRKVENELQETEQRSDRFMRGLLICGVLLVAALGIIGFAVWFIRKLRRINRALYAKNEEVFKTQEEERKIRTRYEGEIADLKNRLNEISQTPAAEPAQSNELPEPAVKYKGSNLSEEDKQAIADKIRNVLENSREIFSTDFSAERLAELVGEKYKYVSQVINEIWQLNFNTLLNNFRIREACKRITDEKNYEQFTIEALAETVGFKSRSTFVSQFKRVTGLTPSQYISESRKS